MKEDFRLGDWVVQPAQCRLSRDGQTLQVRARVMELLIYLAARPGDVVSKAQLLDDVWGSQAVTESALTRTVTELRQALGDSADQPHLLETIPKRGYRLIGRVAPVPDTSAAPAPASVRRRGGTAAGWVAAAIATLLVGLGFWSWLEWNGPATAAVRLALLPFDNIGHDPDRQYLADGLAEDTTVSLGMVDPGSLVVIGRTSTLRYKDTTKSLSEIGRELNADYLVESTVRTDAGHLRLTSKLVRVTDQALIWSRSYDREVSAILGLPGEVSEAIAEQIRFRVTANARESIERRLPANAAAYDLYLRGRVLSNHRKPVMTKRAIDYYNQAIALDPNYAIAWSGIADAYAVGPINGDADPGVSFPLARQAASEALHAGPNQTEVQVSQGIVNFWIEWNWPLAEQMLRRTITQNSGYPLAHQLLGNILSHSGRHAEAQEEMRLARGLDPLDPMLQAISSQDAFNARDYRLAAEHARQAILLDPEFWVGYMELGQALLEQGQTDRSLEALAAAERYSGGNSKPVSTKGYLLAKAGQIGDARAVLEQLTARSHERYVPMYSIALVQAGLGNTEAMFAALEAALLARDVHLIFLTVDPKWDPYRRDPRFTGILERCAFMRRRS